MLRRNIPMNFITRLHEHMNKLNGLLTTELYQTFYTMITGKHSGPTIIATVISICKSLQVELYRVRPMSATQHYHPSSVRSVNRGVHAALSVIHQVLWARELASQPCTQKQQNGTAYNCRPMLLKFQLQRKQPKIPRS